MLSVALAARGASQDNDEKDQEEACRDERQEAEFAAKTSTLLLFSDFFEARNLQLSHPAVESYLPDAENDFNEKV